MSNDDPFSESLFKTSTYRPAYPRRAFDSLLAARQWVGRFVQWVGRFVHWHNHEHRHSAIRFVTPAQRHAGPDAALLRKRAAVYEAARAAHPERWSGDTRNWKPVSIVHLKPDQTSTTAEEVDKNELLKKAA